MSLSQPERPHKYMTREECFPQEVYDGFMDMIQDDKYVCKERLQPHKWSRIQVFLSFPNTETICPKDANIKQQAKSYEIINNKLYRKPEENCESRYSIPRNEVFDIIVRKHMILIHPGRDKTFKEIQKKYHGIVSKEVEWVVRHCRNCSQNRPASVRAPLTPIVANRVFERVQIDLIDFRHSPSDNYAWILHIKDHFSEVCMLFALHSKHAEPIAKCIAIFIQAFFPMEILQCDDGKEFKGALLILLRQYGIKIVHGAPRTPHVQGLVEQANGTIERKIGAWQADQGTSKWEPALTEIARALNRQYVESIGCAPYELVFRQKLRPLKQLTDDERKAELGVPTEEGGVITEADIEAEVGGTALGVTLGSPSSPDIPTPSEPKAQLGIPTLKTHQNDAISIPDRPRRTASKNTPRESTKEVLGVPQQDRYEIQTQYGVINRLLPTKELQRVATLLASGIDVQGPKTKIALSAVAKQVSTSERVIISCKYKGRCYNKRCNCFKNQVKCSVYCHDDTEHDCGYLASLALRTEAALVAKDRGDEGKREGLRKARKRARANTAGEDL